MKTATAVLCIAAVLSMAAFRSKPAAPSVYIIKDSVPINASVNWAGDKTLSCNSGDVALSWGYSIYDGEFGVLRAIPTQGGGGYQFHVGNHDEFMPYDFTVYLYVTCMKFQ